MRSALSKLQLIYDKLLIFVICMSLGSVFLGISLSFGLSFNVLTILIPYVFSFSIGIPALSFINKKIDLKRQRLKHQLYQLECIMKEERAIITSRKIKLNKTFFIPEINAKQGDLCLDNSCLQAINQFLYMINENYYDLIAKDYKKISREFLIDLLITEIVKYFRRTGRNDFDIIDVEKVLNSLFFLDPLLKKEIVKEFKSARIKNGDSYQYYVISKNVTDEMIEEAQFDFESLSPFAPLYNVKDPLFYEYLATNLGEDENNPYGNFSLLDWDYDFVRDAVVVMIEDFKDLILQEKESFDEVYLATFFVAEIGTYVSLNHCKQITSVEIINTFKEWDYLSLELRVAIVDAIFAKFDLNQALYPFFKASKIKKRNNIVDFSKFKS